MFKKNKSKKAITTFTLAKKYLEDKEYDEAILNFKEASKLFKSLKDKTEEEATAYVLLTQGYDFREKKEYIESMKQFGRANVLFSKIELIEKAKKTREEQGITQIEYAGLKASEGEFAEAARLYDSAGAVFQMAGNEREAALARAKSNVQRAAMNEDDFEKVEYLKAATKEFKKAKYPSLIVEAHYDYYRGKTLINTRAREAISCLASAAKKYEKAGSTKQVEKVKGLLEELVVRVKTKPATVKK